MKIYWNKIYSEYLSSGICSQFICLRSETFEKLWNKETSREIIIQKAKEFIDKTPEFSSYYSPRGGSCLFENKYYFSDEAIEKVRIAFLDYCVKNS